MAKAAARPIFADHEFPARQRPGQHGVEGVLFDFGMHQGRAGGHRDQHADHALQGQHQIGGHFVAVGRRHPTDNARQQGADHEKEQQSEKGFRTHRFAAGRTGDDQDHSFSPLKCLPAAWKALTRSTK